MRSMSSNLFECVGVDEPVATTTRAREGVSKSLATLTYPSQLACGDADDESMVRHIGCNHRTGAHHGMSPYRVATDDGAVGSQRGSATDESACILSMYREVGPRRQHIGEDTAGTEEHIVLYLNAFIDRNIVLDAYSVANPHIVAHIDVLAKRTVLPYRGTRLDMTEMPYFGAVAYCDVIVNV